MAELVISLGAGTLWLSPLAVTYLLIRRYGSWAAAPSFSAAYILFFAAQVLVIKVLAVTTGVTTLAAWLVLAVSLVLGFALLIRSHPAPAAPKVPPDDPGTRLIHRIIAGGSAVVFLVLLAFAVVAPVHIWDVLAYHMPMVAKYVQQGSLEPWATQDMRQVMRVNAGELQLLWIALLSGSDVLMELPGILALAVSLVVSFELARLVLGSRSHAFAVVAILLSAPQVVMAATTAKNDLVFTAVLLSAFYWAIRSGTDARPHSAVVFLALSSALAAATKVLGLNVMAATGILLLLLVVRKHLALRHLIIFGAGAAGALLVFAGDIFWRNVGEAPLPVGVTSNEIYFTVGLANISEAARYYIYELGVRRLLTPQIFEHDFGHYGYLYPLLLIFGIAGAIGWLRDRRSGLGALLVVATALFVSIIAFRQPIQWDQRFMLWIIPVLAILSLSLIRVPSPRLMLVIVTAALTLGLTNLSNLITEEFDHLFNRSVNHLVTYGEPARYVDVPNRRYLDRIDGFQTLERSATLTDSVLYVGAANTWMYPAWGPRFTRHVEGVSSASHAHEQVTSRAFAFIVVETRADRELRAVVEESLGRNGYAVLEIADGRTIFVREDGVPSKHRIEAD